MASNYLDLAGKFIPLSWLGWKHIKRKGVFDYFENTKTKERGYRQYTQGYSGLDYDWLDKKES